MSVTFLSTGLASIQRAGEIPDYGTGDEFTVYLPNMQPGFEQLTLVRIPEGSFTMGSPDSETGHEENEGPPHSVTISKPFYMGKYKITQGQWLALMDDNPSTEQGANLPVNKVSWDDCREFIKRLNQYSNETHFRLPTEAEREYACRAETTTPTYFSASPTEETMEKQAWFRNNSEGMMHPVGQLQPNPWGLYDMYGNVWEWCLDWYAPSYPNEPQTDPSGPKTGTEKVIRGGSWMARLSYLRSADRGKFTPDNKRNTGGFRMVWSETQFEQ